MSSLLRPDPLARLPFDVQEDISFHLDRPSLLSLAASSRHLSVLAARALYATVDLCSSPDSSTSKCLLARRQFAFLLAISHHPQYAVFIRHLAFEFLEDKHASVHDHILIPHTLFWTAFEKAKGVVSIDIRMPSTSLLAGPPVNLFPNLRAATLRGVFPVHALNRILSTTRHLHSLTIRGGTVERTKQQETELETQKKSGQPCPSSPSRLLGSLDAFISSSIEHHKWTNLKVMSLAVDTCQTSGVQCQRIQELLSEAATPHLSRLTIETDDDDDDDESSLDKALFAGYDKREKRERVDTMCLKGYTVTPARAEQLKEWYPRVKSVEVTDSVETTEVWLLLL